MDAAWEEAVRSTAERAASSFVPADTPPDLPGPFLLEAFGGYGYWLSKIDPGGHWWTQLQPGASGYGLLVAFHNNFQCCHQNNGYMASCDDEGHPILLPAVVEWVSVIDPSTQRVYHQIGDAYEQDLDFPPVGITNAWWLDDGDLMPWANLIHPNDGGGPDDWFFSRDLEVLLLGLAAPWQILPITEAAATEAREHLTTMTSKWNGWAFGRTNCDLNAGPGDHHDQPAWWQEDEEFEVLHEEPRDDGTTLFMPTECHYELGDDRCTCGRPATLIQEYNALMTTLMEHRWTPEALFLPQELWPAWNLALRNYHLGWVAVFTRKELGDPWSSFCWQRLSPFSGSRSPVEQLRQPSMPSPSSATLPGSSPESSQQLMLFAS